MISTIPSADVNLALLHALDQHNYRGRIAVTAHTSRDAQRLTQTDGAVVLQPFSTAATSVLDMIVDDLPGGTGGATQ